MPSAASLDPVPAATASAVARRPAEAERRQLTVMFCDLVGSTARSERLDPEDMRGIIRSYQLAVTTEAERVGGFVAKYMGDGVLILFGYPQAREEDPEQAVRAGLAIVQAVRELPAAEPLQVRVGIATGLTVVGDRIGTGSSEEQAVVGDAPNLAARLQALAEPDTVVIAEGTRRLVGSLFDLVDLGPQRLKGVTGEPKAWRAQRESRGAGRFESLRGGSAPFMGRGEELDLLVRRWTEAKSGRERTVLVSGEAGIGKSRLTAALLAETVRDGPTVVRFGCSPHATSSALHPVIESLDRAACLDEAKSPAEKRSQLQALLVPARAASDEIRLVADLLGIPAAPDELPLDLTPQKRREITLAILLRQITSLAAAGPVIVVWEDLHWIDPTSLDLLGSLVDGAAGLPILILATARPTFSPPWLGLPHTSLLHLGRLDEQDVARLVTLVAGARLLPSELVEEIVSRTDGVPLFVEELTKTVVEESAARGSLTRVPASLQAALMARLDRLGPAREIAQLGAVIGREFSHGLVAAIAERGPDELAHGLRQLETAELIQGRGESPERTYTFKHALVQDTAYESLLKARRQALHGRVAELLAGDPSIRARQPELLAFHYGRGGHPQEAAIHSLAAGRLAIARSAHAEAITHLKVGIDAPASVDLEVELQTELAQAFLLSAGWTSVHARHALERGIALSTDRDQDRLVALLGRFFLFQFNSVLFDEALITVQRVGALAQKADRRDFHALAHFGSGVLLKAGGQFLEAGDHLRLGSEFKEEFEQRIIYSTVIAVPVLSLSYYAVTRHILGYSDDARRIAEESIRLAYRLDRKISLVFALSTASRLLGSIGDYDQADSKSNEAQDLAERYGFRLYRIMAQIRRGYVLTKRNVISGLQTLEQGLQAFTGTGAVWQYPLFAGYLAEAYRQFGEGKKGLCTIAEAIAIAETTADREHLADLYRVRGLLLWQGGDESGAALSLTTALDVAREQGARMWELRAARDLARLWRDQGRSDEARDLLAPVYGWFSEGFDSADLLEARDLLAELT